MKSTNFVASIPQPLTYAVVWRSTVHFWKRLGARLLLYVAGIVIVFSACRPALPPLSGILPIHAPQIIIAGSPLKITIGPVAATDGTGVGLVLMGSRGPHVYHTTFQHGLAEFWIPGEHTRYSGYMAFVAAADDARGEASLLLEPDPNRKVLFGVDWTFLATRIY